MTQAFLTLLFIERERLRLTQAEAAVLLDVSFRTYQGWEMGTHTPIKVCQEGALARMRSEAGLQYALRCFNRRDGRTAKDEQFKFNESLS